MSAFDKAEKRKKTIKWAIIGSVIAVIVILAIVLPIVLTKSSGSNPNPPPNPPSPVVDNYNPYQISNLVVATAEVSGVISASASYSPEKHQQALNKLLGNGNKLGVHTKGIPQGVNNDLKKNLRFRMGMQNFHVAHFTLTDDDDKTGRYDIPISATTKPDNGD